MKAALPPNEIKRLETVKNLEILDTDDDDAYDAITKLASNIMETPIALISFLDKERQWFKSKVGITQVESSRDDAFCAHAILDPFETTVVQDASNDERFADNPFVLNNGIRFYVGTPLVLEGEYAVGTICALDDKARPKPTQKQLDSLRELSKLVVKQLELRQSILEINNKIRNLNENGNNLVELTIKCDAVLERIKARKYG